MAAFLKLQIVTPEHVAYSEDVDGVVIPGIEGELGILPHHVPLMTKLVPGELIVSKGGTETNMAVGEGFAEIGPDKVSILTDMAINEADIDEQAVKEAMRRAEEAMKGEKLSDEELATVQASIQKSLVQLRVKRKRHL